MNRYLSLDFDKKKNRNDQASEKASKIALAAQAALLNVPIDNCEIQIHLNIVIFAQPVEKSLAFSPVLARFLRVADALCSALQRMILQIHLYARYALYDYARPFTHTLLRAIQRSHVHANVSFFLARRSVRETDGRREISPSTAPYVITSLTARSFMCTCSQARRVGGNSKPTCANT